MSEGADGLSIEQFRVAMKKTMGEHIDDRQLELMFMKVKGRRINAVIRMSRNQDFDYHSCCIMITLKKFSVLYCRESISVYTHI